jgi:hypothetical protein
MAKENEAADAAACVGEVFRAVFGDVGALKEQPGAYVDWYDLTLHANHWFALQDVAPVEAAMLLCQHDPNEISFEQARLTTNDATGPEDLALLVMRFADLAKCQPRHRPLMTWLEFARAEKLPHHPWIDRYAAAAGITAPLPAEVPRPVQRQPAHDAAVLDAVRRAGFDPEHLPPRPRGKAWAAKQAVRAALPQMSKPVFDKAWQRLLDAGKLREG